jgi:hypothetical protein
MMVQIYSIQWQNAWKRAVKRINVPTINIGRLRVSTDSGAIIIICDMCFSGGAGAIDPEKRKYHTSWIFCSHSGICPGDLRPYSIVDPTSIDDDAGIVPSTTKWIVVTGCQQNASVCPATNSHKCIKNLCCPTKGYCQFLSIYSNFYTLIKDGGSKFWDMKYILVMIITYRINQTYLYGCSVIESRITTKFSRFCVQVTIWHGKIWYRRYDDTSILL